MKKEAKDGNSNRKVMTYRNINKRVLRLAKVGLLEEIKADSHTVNIHGRKDYKVSMTGLSCLMPHIMTQSGDANSIILYMERFGLDKRAFGNLLISQVASKIDSATQDLESIKTIYTVNRYLFDYASSSSSSSSMISDAQMRPIKKSYDRFNEMLNDMYDAFDLKLKPTLFVSKQQEQHQQAGSSSKSKKTLLPSTASPLKKKH